MSRLINSEEEAHRVAEEMCRELGKGWEPHVWENGGWCCDATLTSGKMHYTVKKASHECHSWPHGKNKHPDGEYACYASASGPGGHSAVFGDVPHGHTPEEAFANCICQVGDYLEKIENLYNFGNDQFLAEKYSHTT
jgi:hypothetical protein